jgi:uncharacterized protein YecE (DUF72 family)
MNKWSVGTAGWSIASRYAEAFAASGSHLERYSRHLNAVEINSSFNRSHRRETYERWARSVPDHFRFSAKLPRTITHECRMVGCEALLERFLGEVGGLGVKLSMLLVQFPPNLPFDAESAGAFFRMMHSRTAVNIVCEPRHASWFENEAEALLEKVRVARVAADPARFKGADLPGGWAGVAYFRMHGSPRVYYSDYAADMLAGIERRLRDFSTASNDRWCIFDNTAASHALGNALTVAAME